MSWLSGLVLRFHRRPVEKTALDQAVAATRKAWAESAAAANRTSTAG